MLGSFFGGKFSRVWLLAVAFLIIFWLVWFDHERSKERREAERLFLKRCHLDNAVSKDCLVLLNEHKDQCYRMSDFLEGSHGRVDFEQFYACTLLSYEVWVIKQREAKKAERNRFNP